MNVGEERRSHYLPRHPYDVGIISVHNVVVDFNHVQLELKSLYRCYKPPPTPPKKDLWIPTKDITSAYKWKQIEALHYG